MKMEHGLARAPAVIDDHPVAVCIKTFVFCDFSCSKEKMTDQLSIGFGHAVNIGNMFFGHNERVHRSLGIYVFESSNRIVLINDS